VRTVKRLLSFVGVIVFGLFLLFPAAVGAGFVHHFLGDSGIAYFACLSLFVAGLWAYVRDTQKWEFESDIAEYQRGRTRSRTAKVLIWIPSLIAAFVLFFYPVASHLRHPGSQYLTHYRIPIPWTVAVHSFPEFLELVPHEMVDAHVRNSGRGRYGAVLFWEKQPITSNLVFGNAHFEFGSGPASGDVFIKVLHLADITLICREVQSSSLPGWMGVSCQTPGDLGEFNFYARFWGVGDDLPFFYSILSGVTRTK
jgi:hypothetical protein